jgi:hypothetical protein
MRNKFTGYFKGWDICEDCGQRLHRHGEAGLRHPVRGTGTVSKVINGQYPNVKKAVVRPRTGLETHHFVLAKKAELSRPPYVSAGVAPKR